MKQFIGLAALAALTVASPHPRPQFLDLADVIPPSEVAPPVKIPMGLGAVSDVLPVGDVISKRDGDCSPQPAGSGPKPAQDTPSAFTSDTDFSTAANGATTPTGYKLAFQNLKASSQTSAYLGYYAFSSYDPSACAAKCSSTVGCMAFNILFERDPTQDPGANCPNPASTTVIKCVLWGTEITAQTATNTGQYRSQFQVVIAGSNGYNLDQTYCPNIPGYSCHNYGDDALNAPLCNGQNTYLGYTQVTDGSYYDPSKCTAACAAKTGCVTTNSYILLKNGVPQGQICSFYSKYWGAQYFVNNGQYRGSDHYTIAQSEYFSSDDSAVCPAPSAP